MQTEVCRSLVDSKSNLKMNRTWAVYLADRYNFHREGAFIVVCI